MAQPLAPPCPVLPRRCWHLCELWVSVPCGVTLTKHAVSSCVHSIHQALLACDSSLTALFLPYAHRFRSTSCLMALARPGSLLAVCPLTQTRSPLV